MKYLNIIILSFAFYSCSKTPELTNLQEDIPVVESYLTPNRSIEVTLSKMLPYTEDEYTGSLTIDSTNVYIRHNGIDYSLDAVSNEPGKYINSNTGLSITSGETYELYFDYNGSIVSAQTTIPSKPDNVSLSANTLYIDPDVMGPGSTVNPITVSWDNQDDSYHIVVLEYMESSYAPVNVNFDSTNFEQFSTVSTDPVLVGSYDLNTRQHLVFWGTYRVIIHKVNKEYVNLYENISQNSLNLTEPLTNIENGLGIFAGLNSDTLYLEVDEL